MVRKSVGSRDGYFMPELADGIRSRAALFTDTYGLGSAELAALDADQLITYDVHAVWDRLVRIDSHAAKVWAQRHGPGLPFRMDSPAIYEFDPSAGFLREVLPTPQHN